MPNIAIVWDFDGTLTPIDSTSKVVEILSGPGADEDFWKTIKSLRGDARRPKWEHVLAMDAPIWMYSLSRLAWRQKVPLNREFFKEFVIPALSLYESVGQFLANIKSMESQKVFSNLGLQVHHFIVSAGLKDLVEQVFPSDLIS
ncbi:MAG TPA: hypothetical protein P5340_10025 [Defluviicoccus sp.]|nr:hypothetical protein [Defluviicoccus sp.]